MRQINIITSQPWQKMLFKLENGQNLLFEMFYSYNQSGWFYNLKYDNVNLKGRRIVASVNLLRAFKNTLPFGLACILTDKYEPIFIDDFENGRAKIYTLSESDVTLVEELIGST